MHAAGNDFVEQGGDGDENGTCLGLRVICRDGLHDVAAEIPELLHIVGGKDPGAQGCALKGAGTQGVQHAGLDVLQLRCTAKVRAAPGRGKGAQE